MRFLNNFLISAVEGIFSAEGNQWCNFGRRHYGESGLLNFGPFPNAKQYGFFPIPDKKIPNLTPPPHKIFFFFVLNLYFIMFI